MALLKARKTWLPIPSKVRMRKLMIIKKIPCCHMHPKASVPDNTESMSYMTYSQISPNSNITGAKKYKQNTMNGKIKV